MRGEFNVVFRGMFFLTNNPGRLVCRNVTCSTAARRHFFRDTQNPFPIRSMFVSIVRKLCVPMKITLELYPPTGRK